MEIGVVRTVRRASLCAGLSAAVFCAACGQGTPSPSGSVSGTITYDGAAQGGGRPLAIAVYRTYPPSGPPIAWRLVERYEFPYRYSFDNIPPGSYSVGALIDVDTTDTRHVGQLNPARDPHGYAAGGRLVRLDGNRDLGGLDIALREAE